MVRSSLEAASTTGSESLSDDEEPGPQEHGRAVPTAGPHSIPQTDRQRRQTVRSRIKAPQLRSPPYPSPGYVRSVRGPQIHEIPTQRYAVHRKRSSGCSAYALCHQHSQSALRRHAPLNPGAIAASMPEQPRNLDGKTDHGTQLTPATPDPARGIVTPPPSKMAIYTPSDASMSARSDLSSVWSIHDSESDSSDEENESSSTGSLDPDWEQTDSVAYRLREQIERVRDERERMMRVVRNIDWQIQQLDKNMKIDMERDFSHGKPIYEL